MQIKLIFKGFALTLGLKRRLQVPRTWPTLRLLRLLNLAIFPSEDLVATNISDFDDFSKNFNNFCHFLNTFEI